MREPAANEIRAVVDRFVTAFGNDPAQIIAMYTEDAVAIGTGADEVSFGIDAIRSEMDQETSQIDELAMVFDEDPRIKVDGDAGFVFAPVSFLGAVGGAPFKIQARWTLGLVRSDRQWSIGQLHFSLPEPTGSDIHA